MKKVININFQGQVIAIEETAYELLNRYIENLKSYFSREEGGDEIVNDIENRIAELFGNRLKHGINVITDEDVEAITSSIGKPEDFDSDYDELHKENYSSKSTQSMPPPVEEKSDQTESKSLYRDSNDKIIAGVCSGLANYFKIDPVWIRLIFVLFFSISFFVYILLWIILKPMPLESNITKRLYRNPNDKVISGVCGGLAAYFKIDSWIPRLIFAIPFLFTFIGMASFFPLNFMFKDVEFKWSINGTVTLIYIVLWIIVPKATTIKQKVEMMGEKDYIKSIRDTVSDTVASVKNKEESNPGIVPPSSEMVDEDSNETTDDSKSTNIGDFPPKPPKNKVSNATGDSSSSGRSGCLNAIVIFLKVVLIFAATILGIVMIGVTAGLVFAGTALVPLKSLFIDPGYETTLLWTFFILTFALPFVALVVWLIRRASKCKSKPFLGWMALILWIVGIIAGGILASRVVGNFKEVSYTEKNIQLSPVSGDKLYVDKIYYSDDFYTFDGGFGMFTDRSGMPYYTLNEDSLLFSDISVQITESRDSLYHVNLIGSSTEHDLKSAKENTAYFKFEIQQNDSVLLLPEFFSTPINQGLRLQSLIVEISVPSGKKIQLDDSMNEYERGISHDRLRNKLRKFHRNNNYQNWDAGKEYIMQQGELVTTDAPREVLKNDSTTVSGDSI